MTAKQLPKGLGTAGKALFRSLAAVYEFDERETTLLATCARQADDVAALEELIARDGLIVAGSNGQPRLNAAVSEVRQGRIALAKLLDTLALPDETSGKPITTASRRAQHAAQSRWATEGRRRGSA